MGVDFLPVSEQLLPLPVIAKLETALVLSPLLTQMLQSPLLTSFVHYFSMNTEFQFQQEFLVQ